MVITCLQKFSYCLRNLFRAWLLWQPTQRRPLLLACKVALVSIFLVPIILGIPLPFAPIQIIVLELFMDLAASATFVAEPAEEGIMQKPPIDPKEKFLNKPMLRSLFLGALSLFIAVTATFLFAWYTTSDITYARTVAFATWMFGHIFLALNFRSEHEPLIKEGLLSNKVMLLWALLVFVTLIVGTIVAAYTGSAADYRFTSWQIGRL